jgi:hypothetical protein
VFGLRGRPREDKTLTTPVDPGKRTPIVAWQPGRREVFDEAQLRASHPDIIEGDFWEIAADAWDYSSVSLVGLHNLYSACRMVAEKGLEGDVVECGVFFGGSVMVAARTLALYDPDPRRIVAIDTFHGFLRRTAEDVDFNGQEVCEPSDLERKWPFREPAETNIRSVPYHHPSLEIIEGDVLEVLEPAVSGRKIAVLRLDTDTYDTTRHELEVGWPRVVKGGVVIVDDYGWCKGARKAVDDYFRDKPVMIHRIDTWVRSITKA